MAKARWRWDLQLMNIFQRIVNFLSYHAENFLSTTIPLWIEGTPLPSRHNISQLIRESYEGNPLCYASTMEIATSMAEAPLCARTKGSKTPVSDANPLAMILEQPNDFQSMPELIVETTAHMLASGNCYWAMNDAQFPTFMQALPIQNDQVRPIFQRSE